ncbi:hypothetical protein QBC41DRAFT_25209 [Cercophora samala]|uniref:Secreted protein n=1 Tax=Cercophora samala TaxID=330535 RepID=A0AA39ZKH2_9PEZI|nr:hypothetical protein QBC41DRAFT_25209 [Cercophora samala]
MRSLPLFSILLASPEIMLCVCMYDPHPPTINNGFLFQTGSQAGTKTSNKYLQLNFFKTSKKITKEKYKTKKYKTKKKRPVYPCVY